MINLTIDNKAVSVNEGSTILQAAKACGVKIPYLCHYSKLNDCFAACRVCLIEVEGNPRLLAACATPVSEGMKVITDSERIHQVRRFVVELILSNHDKHCITCEKDGDCKLQRLAYEYGIEENRFEGEMNNFGRRGDNPFLEHDYDKCILCGRCVRVCDKIPAVAAVGFVKRGFETKIGTAYDHPLDCVFCGECLYACPTGAINAKMGRYKGRKADLKATETVCPFCGCGCNLSLHTNQGKIAKVSPTKGSIVNDGSLCVKGSFGYDFIQHKDRLTTPLIKENGKFRQAGWDEALDLIANKFKQTKKQHGSDSLAGLSSARCSNEENYLFQKFMRAVIGTNNVDHCARLCHASTVAGLADAFGSGAMTNSMAEVSDAKTIFVTGSNTPETHPIIALQVFKAVRENGAKLIIADPRKLRFAPYASVWMRQKPGTDVALFNSMMHVIIEEGLEDKEFIKERTEGYGALKKVVEKYTPQKGEEITAVPKEQIIEAARIYATVKPASILYSMGVTQHVAGTNGVKSMANLAMLTGNIGKENSGVNPLRGQNNVQGACDLGALPNVYPGYQKVADPASKEKFEKAWGVKLADNVGLTVTEIVKAAGNDKVKAIYIMGENPMLSDPDLNHVRKCLENVEFLVVQDIFLTETAELADVVLPAAGFAEKDGTFTNTERRVQRIRRAVAAPGAARADWEIICGLAERMGAAGFNYKDPSEIMDEIAGVSPIYGGVNYQRIEKVGLQWPCLDKNHPGTKFLHEGKFARGLGKFNAIEYQSPPESPDDEYPLILTTGRLLYHFHTGSMTRRSKGLDEVCPSPFVEINTQDAEKLGVADKEIVKVASRRGEIELQAAVGERCPVGVVFIPFHFKEAAANVLTISAIDPVAKIPELKVCAVKIEKA